MKFLKSRVAAVTIGSIAVVALGAGGAVAGNLITSEDIQNHTIKQRDLSPGLKDKVNRVGDVGAQGPKGAKGDDALLGAVYRTAHYNGGGGGIATVGCADTTEESLKYVAIGGGAYSNAGNGNTASQPMTSSFAGRMDWSTNTPRPGRVDGWVVTFGNGDAPTADKGTLEIYAVCVPVSNLKTEVRNY